MPYEEKSAWVMGVLAVGTYTGYLVVILGRAEDTPLVDVPYVAALLWALGVSIAASIVLHMLIGMFWSKDAYKKDQRDREINRFGEHIGQSFVVIGGVAALGMSMAELDHFWIANAVYLAFVLSAILGSTAKIVAYRRGFQSW
jgi:cell division protein FtsW (lipid II flippase)